MRVRYKKTGSEAWSSSFNMCSMSDVLTGDDSVSLHELDVWVADAWKDMAQAFRDRDIITDNANAHFAEPPTIADRERGYYV